MSAKRKTPPPAPEQEERSSTAQYHVPNLERALLILEFLSRQPAGSGISELARQLELPKNSVFRIVSTLYAHGYLHRDAQGAFTLGRKLLALAHSSIDEHNLVEKSVDLLAQLRDETEETTLIGTLVGDQGVVLEQLPSPHPVKVIVSLGHRYPLHTAAPAKAMLAFLPDEQLQPILARMRFTKFNDNTMTSRAEYEACLTKVRTQGYAVDEAEELDGLHCIAAPVFNLRGLPIAAIWVTGPSFRLRKSDFERVAALVKARAGEISQRFGYDVL